MGCAWAVRGRCVDVAFVVRGRGMGCAWAAPGRCVVGVPASRWRFRGCGGVASAVRGPCLCRVWGKRGAARSGMWFYANGFILWKAALNVVARGAAAGARQDRRSVGLPGPRLCSGEFQPFVFGFNYLFCLDAPTAQHTHHQIPQHLMQKRP